MYKYKQEEGFNGGLIIWAVFILVFALLGVPAALCILLGAFGGGAVWLMIAYWRAEKLPEEAAKPEQQEQPDVIRPVRRLFERVPISSWRDRFVSPFRPKPPRRLGRTRRK